ncbi:SH3 domain-containing protein [Bacillus sp. FJAT-27251]|uniref:SH3 domain-containing protein n=1 Tax=Bacillus sp. FJAT-27251 TaxID=1684142 RepID=UPI0006A766D5|nr:SH3 domain-containing protein [Bacillus sp. FJAT-27251]
MKTVSFVSRIICILVIFTLFVSIDGNRAEAAYTYQEKVNVDILNVRANAGTGYAIIGKLKKDQVVTVHDNRQGWSKIAFGQGYGWVSSQYLTNVTWTGYVNATTLNVRSTPSTTARILTQVGTGTAVTVQGKNGSWMKVYIPSKRITGWVHGDYISNKATSTASQPSTWTGYVNATTLNVRSAPSTTARILTQIGTGTAVTVQGKDGSWMKVYIPSKKVTGWVHSDYISNKASASAQVVLLHNTNLRRGPGTSYGIISVEPAGTSLTKIGQSNDWIQVRRKDGVTGWVAGWLVGSAQSSPLKGKTVLLDPGHGGIDGGASGRLYVEKRLNLSTALKLGSLLQQAGAKVIYTRSSDIYVSLNQRVAISNQSNADAFISIHYNSCTGVCSGIETFYYSMSKDSALARSIQNNLIKSTQLRDRGTKYGAYRVIRNNHRPAAMVELGFLSNPTEERLIGSTSHQKKAAQGIYNGLVEYLK